MKYALSKRTLLETALIRCARGATVVTLEEILEKIDALRGSIPAASSRAVPSRETPPERREADGKKRVAENSRPSYTAGTKREEEADEDELGRCSKAGRTSSIEHQKSRRWQEPVFWTQRLFPLHRRRS